MTAYRYCTVQTSDGQTHSEVETKQAKMEQRERKATEVMKRNLFKAAQLEECVVVIARAIENILKALDIANRPMLTLRKANEIIRQKKWLMTESEKEGYRCKKLLMVGNSRGNRRMRRLKGRTVSVVKLHMALRGAVAFLYSGLAV